MRFLCTLTVLGFILITSAAHSQRRGYPPSITVIDDTKVRSFVAIEGRKILAVTKNRDKAKEYRFYLADSGGRWAGMATGNHVIYVHYKYAKTAYLNRKSSWDLLSLRAILAHEIAHDILRHSKYGHRSSAKELAADRLGIILWKRLGWNCSFWVDVYEGNKQIGFTSITHRTDLHLLQAQELCPEAEDRKKEAMNKELRELELLEQQLEKLPPPK